MPEDMEISEAGKMVREEWQKIVKLFNENNVLDSPANNMAMLYLACECLMRRGMMKAEIAKILDDIPEEPEQRGN